MSDEGPIRRETEQEVVDRELAAEQERWREAGIPHPSTSFTTDIFVMFCELQVLKDLVMENGLTTPEEVQVAKGRKMTEFMRMMREQMQEQRRNEIVARTMPILPPNGKLPFEQ